MKNQFAQKLMSRPWKLCIKNVQLDQISPDAHSALQWAISLHATLQPSYFHLPSFPQKIVTHLDRGPTPHASAASVFSKDIRRCGHFYVLHKFNLPLFTTFSYLNRKKGDFVNLLTKTLPCLMFKYYNALLCLLRHLKTLTCKYPPTISFSRPLFLKYPFSPF